MKERFADVSELKNTYEIDNRSYTVVSHGADDEFVKNSVRDIAGRQAYEKTLPRGK